MPDALILKGVSAGYGETHVLEEVDLALAEGESLSIIGRNGVGKSTLLETVMGNTTLHAGAISFRGRRIEAMPPHERALAGLGYVPQEREIFPSLSVLENLQICARPGPWDYARVYELFPNLKNRLANAGTQLSGGEQQMLAIARALMTNPELLLLDEPLEGLAPIIVEELAASLKNLQGMASLLVEQHTEIALSLTGDALVLERGRVAHRARSADFAKDTETLERYVGLKVA